MGSFEEIVAEVTDFLGNLFQQTGSSFGGRSSEYFERGLGKLERLIDLIDTDLMKGGVKAGVGYWADGVKSLVAFGKRKARDQ